MSGTGDSEHGAQGCDLVQLVSSSLTADTLAQRPEQGKARVLAVIKCLMTGVCSRVCHLSVNILRVPGALPPRQYLHCRKHLLQEKISG